MQRAAHGLAYAVLDLLGRGYGARVLLLVGAGNNGGDALYAGAVLARRGVGVEAVLLAPEKAHAAGLAALTRAGGRVVGIEEATPPDVVVDGIVGIGASPACATRPSRRWRSCDGVPVVAVDLPSGVDADTGELDGPHVQAALTVTFGTHKVALLADPAAAGCRRRPPRRHRPRRWARTSATRASRHCRPPTSPRCCRHRQARAQKYSRGVVGVRTGSAQLPRRGGALGRRGGLRARRHGPVRRRRRPSTCWPRTRRPSPGTAASRRGWSGRAAATTRPTALARSLAGRRPRGRRRRRAGGGRRTVRRRPPCSPRTPASSRGCSA